MSCRKAEILSECQQLRHICVEGCSLVRCRRILKTRLWPSADGKSWDQNVSQKGFEVLVVRGCLACASSV